MPLPDSLAPLREAGFRWYFAARFVSTAGTMMAPVALAFAVLAIEESAGALGQVLAARTIPMVALLLFGGVIADRTSPAAVLVWSNLASGVTQAVVATLVITGNADLTTIIVLEAINGTATGLSYPALFGIVPRVAQRTHLQQANALLSLSRGGLAILGPSVAAVLVVTVGAGWALAVDAVTWLVAAAMLTRLRLAPVSREVPSSSMLRELREGWVVFSGTTWLWVVVVAFGVINAIHTGVITTLGPAVALDTVGEGGWGLALSAEAIGMLLMTVVMLRLTLRRPLLWGMLGMLPGAIPVAMLGVDPRLAPLVVAMFVAGAGTEVFNIGWNVAMQENIDPRMLSRAYSYDSLGSFVAMPVGQLVYGPLAESLGVRPVLVGSAALYVGVVLATLASREVRSLGRVRQPA